MEGRARRREENSRRKGHKRNSKKVSSIVGKGRTVQAPFSITERDNQVEERNSKLESTGWEEDKAKRVKSRRGKEQRRESQGERVEKGSKKIGQARLQRNRAGN